MSPGDRIGCLTVIELLEAAQARERDLRTKTGKPLPQSADGAQALVRCGCLLEFIVRARELSRKKNRLRCGSKCELGKGEAREAPEQFWTHCRNPLCGGPIRTKGPGNRNLTGFCRKCQCGKVPGGLRWFKRSRPGVIAHEHAVDKAWRARKQERGECLWCKEPAAPDRVLCAPHAAKDRAAHKTDNVKAYQQRRRDKQRATGKCGDCEKPAASGKRRCQAHLDADKARWMRRRAAKAAEQMGVAA